MLPNSNPLIPASGFRIPNFQWIPDFLPGFRKTMSDSAFLMALHGAIKCSQKILNLGRAKDYNAGLCGWQGSQRPYHLRDPRLTVKTKTKALHTVYTGLPVFLSEAKMKFFDTAEKCLQFPGCTSLNLPNKFYYSYRASFFLCVEHEQRMCEFSITMFFGFQSRVHISTQLS